MVTSSCEVHVRPLQNPNCSFAKSLLSTRRSYRAWRINPSNILHNTDVRLTGLQFPGAVLLPFLKIGRTSAIFHLLGILPSLRDLLNNFHTGYWSCSESSFNILGWTLSGPGDLFGFKDLKDVSICSCDIVMLESLLFKSAETFGIFDVSSVVYTLLK